MVSPDRPPKNGLNKALRKVYNPLGFTRFYNFVLWFIFSGALFGFILARVAYLNYNGIFCGGSAKYGAAPGECATYKSKGYYKTGILMHLATLVPACLLVLLQFAPFIRHRFIFFHRINGYIVIILAFVTFASVLMIARVAFGGTLDTQLWIGWVVIISAGSLVLAYVNIKQLQIDQHRKWMLRAWFYMGSIISQRLIFLCIIPIITEMGSYYYSMPCWKIAGIFENYGIPEKAVVGLYPTCIAFLNGTSPNLYVTVHAGNFGRPEQTAAALDMSFGTALWLALMLHAVGIEIYLHLTPKEHERLRQVSYERQLERGRAHPGRSWLTVDTLGDTAQREPSPKHTSSGDKEAFNGEHQDTLQ